MPRKRAERAGAIAMSGLGLSSSTGSKMCLSHQKNNPATLRVSSSLVQLPIVVDGMFFLLGRKGGFLLPLPSGLRSWRAPLTCIITPTMPIRIVCGRTTGSSVSREGTRTTPLSRARTMLMCVLSGRIWTRSLIASCFAAPVSSIGFGV